MSDRLHEHAERPEDAIPFHQLFGASLENGELATSYDAARSEAFINARLGLTRD